MNNKEQVDITNESTKVISWTPTRRSKFGQFPEVEVYINRTDPTSMVDSCIKTPIQPSIDAAPPAFTTMTFDFGGPVSGFILIF